MNPRPDIAYHQARILIVDDEHLNRQLLEVMLTPEAFVLVTAASGEEALAIVAQQPPDLILLDVMMPGMDGYQVAGRIKGNVATRSIPIIMITALDDRDARMLGLTAGAEDFLTKPVDRAELCVRVRNLLRLKAHGDYYDKYSQLLEGEVVWRTADLVERTKVAAVLTEQAALLDLAQDAIVVRDMHGRIVFWSHGAEMLYGWLSQEALGRDKQELLKTEFSEPREHVEATLLRQGQWEGEATHDKRDGTRVSVAIRLALQCDADGTPIRVLAINNDITRRKQIESERLLLTERLSLATAVAKVGVWEWDLAGNMLTWDATMFDIYGFPPVVPMPYERWSAALHPEDLAAVESSMRRAIEEKSQGSAEFRIIRTDGAVRNLSRIERVVLDERGNVSRVIGVSMDVTERKEAETELRTAKDAAEAANRAKSEFLANMSHEIRTPMNGVIGMTNLILETELTSKQQEYLGMVKSSADALLTIINDILDFSRIESGKFELDPMDFNARDAIGDTANTVALGARQKGLELIVDVDAAVPHMVRGDPGRLRQILINLLGNAIKFTNHGEVVLRVTMEAATPKDVVLHFSIRDTGVGIPLDRQKSIFEAFTQADSSMTRMYGGTGLGLTISSQIVDLMGGRIWVESEVGRGSTFQFTASFALVTPTTAAPVAETVDPRRSAERDSPALATRRSLREEGRQPGRILLVENNSINQLVARRLLETRGHTVLVANNGREALTMLDDAASIGFGCVLMDIKMPEMNGFECTAAIRDIERTTGAHIPIVAITAYAGLDEEARCLSAGMDAYLSKPIQPTKFFEIVDHLLAGSIPSVSHAPLSPDAA